MKNSNIKTHEGELPTNLPESDNISDRGSDSETIEHSAPNYEHLLNELKMKSQALAKASNLIEILQLEVREFRYRLAGSLKELSLRSHRSCRRASSIDLLSRNIETTPKGSSARRQEENLRDE